MKKYITTFAVFLLAGIIFYSFKHDNNKIGPHLTYVMNNPAENNFTVWIYFRDKGPNAFQKLSDPLQLVSQKSIERRLKVKDASNVVDMADVPVYEDYVQNISGHVDKIRNRLCWINAVSAEVTREQIEELVNVNEVTLLEIVERYKKRPENIEEEIPVTNTQNSPQDNMLLDSLNYGPSGTTQITQMNVNLVHNQSIFGQGVIIASLDDGFRNQTHPAFNNAANPLVVLNQYDFQLHIPGANHTTATHGTTTISCIGAYAPGTLIGTAFKSKFLVARTEVDSFERPIEMDNWMAASRWADSNGADIITSSLGYLVFDAGYGGYSWTDMNGRTLVVTNAGDFAVSRGIVVFNSAGNDGPNASHNTLSGPADGDSVITMGAVNGNGLVSSFSSVGPTTDVPARIKPDVMAMGNGVQTANGTGTGYSGGGSAGTSYSCPLAAGVGALILSANKNLTPMQVRGILRKFASMTNSPNNTYGWGIINAALSVDSARKMDNVPPVIAHTQPFTNTNNTGVITMKSKITDNGIIRNWTNQTPMLYFRKSTNGGSTWTAYTAVTASYINAPANDSFFFDITGSALGTRVEYYFAAQDIALPNPLMSTLPAGGSGINPPGTTAPPTRFTYNVLMTGIVSLGSEIPSIFNLYNNFPNPFNPNTKIRFDIPANLKGGNSKVKLTIYDITGKALDELINKEMTPGKYEADWNAVNASSGVYFYKLEVLSEDRNILFSDVKKMMVVK